MYDCVRRFVSVVHCLLVCGTLLVGVWYTACWCVVHCLLPTATRGVPVQNECENQRCHNIMTSCCLFVLIYAKRAEMKKAAVIGWADRGVRQGCSLLFIKPPLATARAD